MAPFPELIFRQLGGAKIWADTRLLEGVDAACLSAPDRLFERPGCKTVKDQRKIKVGRVDLQIDGNPKGVYVKRYNAFSIRYRLTSLFLTSGAVKCLKGAEVLAGIGISTGHPLAAVECRSWGMLSSSFFLSEEIVHGKTPAAHWREDLRPLRGGKGFSRRREFIRGLAGLFGQLHRANVYHNDLKDANILIVGDAAGERRFSLLDLDGVRRCKFLSRRRRIKNLVQLNRTLGRDLSRSDKLVFLKAYLGSLFGSEVVKRKWVYDILSATRAADRRSLRKRSRPGSEN